MKRIARPATLLLLSTTIFMAACQDEPPVRNNNKPAQSDKPVKEVVRKTDSVKKEEKPAVTEVPASGTDYHFISQRNKNKAIKDSAVAELKRMSPAERAVVLKLNRVDAASYRNLDTMIIPNKIDTNWMAYSVFPAELPVLKDVRKMIIFSYYAEAYGAYENGRLIKWGPTNMGKKASPTPTGLFSCNWKAKETHSTVNDEWVLKWNFNISNAGGVGFHQYQLPGYPASHSCLRLLEADAFYFYNWAEQWILEKGGATFKAQGTPVLVYGAYPFGKSKPWWGMVANPNALAIPSDTLNNLIQPNLEKILARQKQYDEVKATMPQKNTSDSTVVSAPVQP